MKTVQLPDQVYDQAAKLAALDRLSVDRFLAGLIEDHARAWCRLQDRASRGSVDKLHHVLSKVAALPPEPADQL